MRKLLADAIESVDVDGPMILLENTASVKTGVGSDFGELGELLGLLGDKKRYGIALDTAHALGAGYDLSSAEGVKKSVSKLYKAVGKSRVKIVHANDSKAEVASGRDLHEHIGKGSIGKAGFKALLGDPTLSKLPFILETPQDKPTDVKRNLTAIRKLVGRKKA